MVGFVERFRKPKLPIVLGSPPRDGASHQQFESRPPNVTPPVLRNFSYPTNITNYSPSLSAPAALEEPPSTWDQLGEICTFSPSIAPRTRRQDRTAGLEDPFFYTTDRTPYQKLVDEDEKICTSPDIRRSTDSVRWTPRIAKSAHKCEPKHKSAKTFNAQSVGDYTSSQKFNVTAILKRSSLGHHKTSLSFDTSRLLTERCGGLERPMSSSGVPLIDTRVVHSISKTTNLLLSPLYSMGDTIEEALAVPKTSARVSYTMDPSDSRRSSQGLHTAAPHSREPPNDRQRGSQVSEPPKRKGRDAKSRWFSQLKEWVSVSEPSTQALKNYKKDTYNKAGIALDDPLASAKLHLPVASLPPDAIKPGGRGPEPEEIIIQRAMKRKKARELLSSTGTSQGSRSDASHYSSSSSVTVSAPKDSEKYGV
ncbi:hypothetical protein F4678DRAFT_478405 [Xylaria arbuscula]|nr:hypothetical protein F4678DRAFT_478405 [Xylaria arbuscula]